MIRGEKGGKSGTGSDSGTSGWTGELLAALIGDSICLEGLTCLVSDICNGDLPESDRALILGSTLISGKKSDAGVRPIAMGEVFYTLAGHVVMQLVSPLLPAILEPVQLAHSRGGSATALHVLQSALEAGGPSAIALKT